VAGDRGAGAERGRSGTELVAGGVGQIGGGARCPQHGIGGDAGSGGCAGHVQQVVVVQYVTAAAQRHGGGSRSGLDDRVVAEVHVATRGVVLLDDALADARTDENGVVVDVGGVDGAGA